MKFIIGRSIGSLGTVVSNWLLATGFWNDGGVWDDSATWND